MAHEIDTTTGSAAVFVTGEAAWHRLGIVVKDAQTSEQAIQLAGLNWKVGKQPVFLGDGTLVPATHAVTRDDTGAVLGVVGDFYRPFQNHEAFDFMDALVGDKLAMYETAGSLHGGKRVWMMARIPREFKVGSKDSILPYVLLTNSHDGTSAVRMIPTSVRVVCQNTLNLALRGAGSSGISLRHFSNLQQRVSEARNNLGIIGKRFDAYQEEIDALARVRMTPASLKDYVLSVFPTPAAPIVADNAGLLDSIIGGQSARSEIVQDLLAGNERQQSITEKNHAKILDQILGNYQNQTNTLPGVEGTAWAAYNAVSEYADHQSNVRGGDNARLNSIWFGKSDEIKQVAYRNALALAK